MVDYALRVAGSAAGVRASQRDLSKALLVAPGMVGRYLRGEVAFDALRAVTVYLLAQAARLDVSTLYVWSREGREAAMAHQQVIGSGEAVSGQRPLDLAEQLVERLRQQAVAQDQEDAQIAAASAPEEVVYSEEDARGISEMCRDAFRRIATDQLLSPKEAWEALKPLCDGMSAEEITRFREVLSGWSDWSAEEVMALSVPGGLGKPAQALDRLGGSLTISWGRAS